MSDDEAVPLRVYKVELLIVDHDKLGDKGIKSAIENARYANRCIMPNVVALESREVQWTDDHPLNLRDGWRPAYEALFKTSDARACPECGVALPDSDDAVNRHYETAHNGRAG